MDLEKIHLRYITDFILTYDYSKPEHKGLPQNKIIDMLSNAMFIIVYERSNDHINRTLIKIQLKRECDDIAKNILQKLKNIKDEKERKELSENWFIVL